MLLRAEELNDIVGFDLSEDSFFSEGSVILLDGNAWELAEQIGDQLIFKESSDVDQAKEDMEFFTERKDIV